MIPGFAAESIFRGCTKTTWNFGLVLVVVLVVGMSSRREGQTPHFGERPRKIEDEGRFFAFCYY